MIIRMFDTAMSPEDIERGKELFRTQVQPAFAEFDGCLGIEMYLGLEEHSRGLVDVAAISRWESKDHIEKALVSDDYREALAELKTLFQQNPIVRHFETID
ncbi:MAG: antibiotic biosynthesis monooxygenase family protein [Actinomycetota bacterium]